jgi:hypothetical protein
LGQVDLLVSFLRILPLNYTSIRGNENRTHIMC